VFFLLSMVAGMIGGEGPLLLGSEVDPSDPGILCSAASLKSSIRPCYWYYFMDTGWFESHGVAAAFL
jgi:hypothetical protein